MRRAEPAERAERISTPSAVPEVSGRNLRGLGRASGVAEVAETISNAERAGEFLARNLAASALSAFNPSPRPRVRPRGSGRVRGDNLNAGRAEHAGEFLVKSSAASALSAFNPWPRPRVRPRGSGRVRGDNLTPSARSTPENVWSRARRPQRSRRFIRLRDLGCVRAGVAECAETI